MELVDEREYQNVQMKPTDFQTFLRPFVCVEPKKTALRTDFHIEARTLIKSHLFGFQRYFQIYSNLVKLLIYKNSNCDLIKGSVRKIMVGFIYTFWYTLSSTGSILEQGFYSVHHLQMTSSEGFQQHFSVISKFVCCGFYMKKNVAFTLISFAVLK